MKRRTLCAAGLVTLLASTEGWTQAVTAAKKPIGIPWRLVINEAVTGDNNFFLLTSRYQPLADFVTTQFKGHLIGVEPVIDIKRFMSVAQAEHKPELVFGKSVNQLAKLVRDNGYQPLVRRSDPYKAAFIVAKNSPIKALADIGKAKIIMPDEFAATTAVAKAELRRQNVTQAEIVHVRYQEAVSQQVTAGTAQVGVVNPTTAKKWVEQGGRVLAETQPVVNWSMLASPSFPAESLPLLRTVLMSMNTQAPVLMGALGVKEWAKAERKEYLDLLDYTKE
jgi:ABC-type phosphate/phosphonate transport system substrate-binding protein